MDLAECERNINDVTNKRLGNTEREFPNLLLYRAIISLLNQ